MIVAGSTAVLLSNSTVRDRGFEGLLNIPSLCIVTENDNIWDRSTGIYMNGTFGLVFDDDFETGSTVKWSR